MRIFKNFLDKYIIYPNEFYNFLSIYEDYDLVKLKKYIYTSYYHLLSYSILSIINLILFFYLFISIKSLLANKVLSTNFVILCVLIIVIVFVRSFILNKYIAVAWQFVVASYLNKFINNIGLYLNPKNKSLLTDLHEQVISYTFDIANVIYNFMSFTMVFLLLVVSDTTNNVKFGMILTILFLSVMFVIIGKRYSVVSIKIRKALLNDNDPLESDINQRVLIPFIWNFVTHTFLPIMGVYLVIMNLGFITAQFVIISSLITFFWSFMSSIEKYYLSKSHFTKLNNVLTDLISTHIINNKTFLTQCELSTTSQKAIDQSFKNKSLVLINFSPKKFSVGKGHADDITFEFLPGLYQLMGLNGVGKSTFLESISLPKASLVEFSENQAAFNGKPLFDKNFSLECHRQKVICLNRNSKIKEIKSELIDSFKTYKALTNFLENLLNQDRKEYSEGEKAIVLILQSVLELAKNNNDKKILIIDEMISRIYNQEGYKIRDEVVDILKNSNNNNIIIVVDHVIDIDHAVKLEMTVEGIKFV